MRVQTRGDRRDKMNNLGQRDSVLRSANGAKMNKNIFDKLSNAKNLQQTIYDGPNTVNGTWTNDGDITLQTRTCY